MSLYTISGIFISSILLYFRRNRSTFKLLQDTNSEFRSDAGTKRIIMRMIIPFYLGYSSLT